ncbi:SET domain protein, putative [Plasmodium relictum]|uniref:[histone H3]-lysine(4) N-trimethyltransferase n=1 Tax=Plasmodium relictum TaxID=85471 RepID=A0A1J1HB74_PLARL|nr:SET domain protein, putative [Plasmodium relictum]CRH00840.1 SET domain protein, putative [Plasmodium relictum]
MNKLKEKKKIKKLRHDKTEITQKKEKGHTSNELMNTLKIKDGTKGKSKNEKKTQINIRNDLFELKNNKIIYSSKNYSIHKVYDKVEELKNKKKILNDNNNDFSKIESRNLLNVDSSSCHNYKSKVLDRKNCKSKSKKLKIENNASSKTNINIIDLKKKKIVESNDSKKLLNDKNLKENKLIKNKKIMKNTYKKCKPERLENKKSLKNNFSDASINLEKDLNNRRKSSYLLISMDKKKSEKNIFLKSLIKEKSSDSDVNNSKPNRFFNCDSLKNINLNPLENINCKFKSSKGFDTLFMYKKNSKSTYFTNSSDHKSYKFSYKCDINKAKSSYSDTNISYSPKKKKKKKKNIYNILFYDECFKEYQYNNEENTPVNNFSKIYELFFNIYKKRKLINAGKNKVFLKKNIFFPYANYNFSLRSIQKRKYNINFKGNKDFKIRKKTNKIKNKEEIKINEIALNNKNDNEYENVQNNSKCIHLPVDTLEENELNKIKYNKIMNIKEYKEKKLQNINNLEKDTVNKVIENNYYIKSEEYKNIFKENNSKNSIDTHINLECKENEKIDLFEINIKEMYEEKSEEKNEKIYEEVNIKVFDKDKKKNEEIGEKVCENTYEKINDKADKKKSEESYEKINKKINKDIEEKTNKFILKKSNEEISDKSCEETNENLNKEEIKKIYEEKNKKSDKEINENKYEITNERSNKEINENICKVISEKKYEETKEEPDNEQNEKICNILNEKKCKETYKKSNKEINEEKCQEFNEQIKELSNKDINKGEIEKNEIGEGTNKELKISLKNFIKYDETIFESFYNDIFLKKGKIVTNKRKKYFLTYKIIKDCYFRILILNSEKLEKNILQIIAIQDVVLSDKNVKIESDTLYIKNNDKFYAVNFLKVFCLKYLKKLKKINEIIFSDYDTYTNEKEKHEVSEVHTINENKSNINIKKENIIENNTNDISSVHNSMNELNSFNQNSSGINLFNKNTDEINIINNDIGEENISRVYNDKYKESKTTDNTLNDLNDNYSKGERELRKTTKTIKKEKNHKTLREKNMKINNNKEENISPYKNIYDFNKKKKKLDISKKKKRNSHSTSKKRKVNEINGNITEKSLNLNIRKNKNRNNLKIKRKKESQNVEECNYSGFIYNEKKKFYFNVHKIKDIINMIKGSEEKTKFYLDTNNSNIKKKLKLLKKVQNVLFLENLNIDENEVLFKKPKFFNCIIEESLDNYNVMYQVQDGKYHMFENKLDEMKRKKKKKAENDSSNKYIELKDEEKGFKYIGYRVSFELKKDNKKKRHVKIGIIKYYSPKYKQFFIHHIENYRYSIQSDTPKSINKEISHIKNNDNSFLNIRKNNNSFNDMKKYANNSVYNLCDNEDVNENNRNNEMDENDKEKDNEKFIKDKEAFTNYENGIDEENDKKKNDFIFSDIKGWYSPYFYNIKILKTTKEFERFDILEKNDKKKEMNDNILKRNDECSICKCKIFFMKGYDHYTNNLSVSIYELSSEKEKKKMDEENMINIYWGVKCFICSKKFHANCLDDDVIITKSYDKNILMKEYKKYIYKNSLKKDKKCFNIEKEKSSKNMIKAEEKIKVKGNSIEQKTYKEKKSINNNNNNSNSNNNTNKNCSLVNSVNSSNYIDSSNDPLKGSCEKSSKSRENSFSEDKNDNVCVKSETNYKKDEEKNNADICCKNDTQNDDLNEIGNYCINENKQISMNEYKNDVVNDYKNVDEFSEIDTNNCMKIKNRKYRKCINYIPSVKYNDITYKKFLCKDCYRCIYCCESIYNYKQTPNIANYVICKNCHMVAHGSCCFPNVPDIYLFNWKCDDCLKCNKCNYSNLCFINYNEWEFHLDCCINCYKEYEKKNFCIICNEKYEMNDSSKWVQCDVCKFWIHLSCDKNENRNIEILSIKNINYKCPTCSYGSFYDKIERILYLLFLLDKYKNFTFHVPINFYIYWRIVKIPMNLYIMKKKIWEKKYNTILDFLYDFILIIHNAKTVHMPNTSIYKNACNFEKKGKVIIKNMFNMNNEELNKYIEECLDKYKRVVNEEVDNNDNIKNGNDIKNNETTFTSDINKLGSGNNSSKEDAFVKTNEYLIDRKNSSTDSSIANIKKKKEINNNNESLCILEKKKVNLSNNNYVEGNNYLPNDSHSNFVEANNIHELDNNAHILNNDHSRIIKTNNINVNNTSEIVNLEDTSNIANNNNFVDVTSCDIDKRDNIKKEKKLFFNYEGYSMDNSIKKEDIFYGIKISSNNKNIINSNIHKKRKLENIEKDITKYEIHELFNLKSNSFFTNRNKEMFASFDNHLTNYNIININTNSKIYFNRNFDKYDDFDVCKILKVYLLKNLNKNLIEVKKSINEQESILHQHEKDHNNKKINIGENEKNTIKENEKDKNKQNENEISGNENEINIRGKNVSELNKNEKYDEKSLKKTNNTFYEKSDFNLFISNDIFMIDVLKEKINFNNVKKEEKKIVSPLNNVFNFLKCIQIIFFDNRTEHNKKKKVSTINKNYKYENDENLFNHNKNATSSLGRLLNEIVPYLGKKSNCFSMNVPNSVNYCFYDKILKKKKRKIKLFKNDILKEYCHICGSIEYKNSFLFCSVCGISVHYSCVNIVEPFLFNLKDFDDHKKEINKILNVLTRNFKCSNCIKCDKCYNEFDKTSNDAHYFKIKSFNVSNNIFENRTHLYLYNLKIELNSLKEINSKKRKCLKDKKSDKNIGNNLNKFNNEKDKNLNENEFKSNNDHPNELVSSNDQDEKKKCIFILDNQKKKDQNENSICCNNINTNDINAFNNLAKKENNLDKAHYENELEVQNNSTEKDLNKRKYKEKENLTHINQNNFVKILSIYDETSKIFKCFCCGKSSHNECFYLIDDNTNDILKSKVNISKKTLKNLIKKSNYVKRNYNRKVEKCKNSKALNESSEKNSLMNTNNVDSNKVYNENIKTKNFKSNILDNSLSNCNIKTCFANDTVNNKDNIKINKNNQINDNELNNDIFIDSLKLKYESPALSNSSLKQHNSQIYNMNNNNEINTCNIANKNVNSNSIINYNDISTNNNNVDLINNKSFNINRITNKKDLHESAINSDIRVNNNNFNASKDSDNNIYNDIDIDKNNINSNNDNRNNNYNNITNNNNDNIISSNSNNNSNNDNIISSNSNDNSNNDNTISSNSNDNSNNDNMISSNNDNINNNGNNNNNSCNDNSNNDNINNNGNNNNNSCNDNSNNDNMISSNNDNINDNGNNNNNSSNDNSNNDNIISSNNDNINNNNDSNNNKNNSNYNYNHIINSKLENALKDHDIIMEKLKEYRTNRNNIDVDNFSNNLILNNELIIDYFKVDPEEKINNETIVINKKIFNKVILDKIYELIKKKKRIKIKNLLSLFKIDEFRCNFILYEILNAMNSYLNEKLSRYKSTKLEKNTKRENIKKKKNENLSLFDGNFISNNRDEMNITKNILKIQSLITDILSNALNGKIINEKNRIKKNHINYKKNVDYNYNKNNKNRNDDNNNKLNNYNNAYNNNYNSNSNDMLLNKDNQNLLALYNYSSHNNKINKDIMGETAFCDTYNVNNFKNINGINSLNVIENINNLKTVNNINSMKHKSTSNSVNGIDDINNIRAFNNTDPSIINYFSERKKSLVHVNKDMCELSYNFNETNFKKIDSSNNNIDTNINSKINFNTHNYNKLSNLNDLNKSNNMNINMNNLNNIAGYNSNKNDIHNINNINTFNNNNVDNLNNFNGKNLNSDIIFNNVNNLDNVNVLYKANGTNNINNNEYLNSLNNIENMNIMENVKILSSNNALIDSRSIEGQSKILNFNNMINLNNMNNEDNFSGMNNLKNIDNLYNFNDMTNSNEINNINNYNSMRTLNDIRNLNGTNSLNDMNNRKNIKNFNDINSFKNYIPHNSININEPNFQNPSYITNKMSYLTNEIYLNEDVNKLDSYKRGIDLYKCSYYFYNKMLVNNNPNNSDNLNINTTSTDYNFLKNKNNNFIRNRNKLSFNQIKNEDNEMNENLISNISNNNDFTINDENYSLNNSSNLEYIKKDDNDSTFQNVIFQNTSDIYQINNENNFSKNYYINKIDQNHYSNNVNNFNNYYNTYQNNNNKNINYSKNLLKSNTLNYDNIHYTSNNKNVFYANNLHQNDELMSNISNHNKIKCKTNVSGLDDLNERNVFFQDFDNTNGNSNNINNNSFGEVNFKININKNNTTNLIDENKYNMAIENYDKVVHNDLVLYENNNEKKNHLNLDNENKNKENNFPYTNLNKIENYQNIDVYKNNYSLNLSEKNINDEMLERSKKIKKRKLYFDYKNILIKKENDLNDNNVKKIDINNTNNDRNKCVEKIKFEKNIFNCDTNKLSMNNMVKNEKKKKTKEEKEKEKKMREEMKKNKKKEKQKEKEKEKEKKNEKKKEKEKEKSKKKEINNKKREKQKEKEKKSTSSNNQLHPPLKNNSSLELSDNNNLICKNLSNGEISLYVKKEQKNNIHNNNVSDELSSHSYFFESNENSLLNKDQTNIVTKNMKINKLTNFLKNNKFILKSKFKRITPRTYICLSCITLYKNDFSFNFLSELEEFEKILNENNNGIQVTDTRYKSDVRNSSLVKKEIKREGKRVYTKRKKSNNNDNLNKNGNDINKERDNDIVDNTRKHENNINKENDNDDINNANKIENNINNEIKNKENKDDNINNEIKNNENKDNNINNEIKNNENKDNNMNNEIKNDNNINNEIKNDNNINNEIKNDNNVNNEIKNNDNNENCNSNNIYYETNEKYEKMENNHVGEITNIKNEKEQKDKELRIVNNLGDKENNNLTKNNVENGNDTVIYNKEKKIYKKNYNRISTRKNKSKYFQINNEKSIKYDRECVYWINKISLYNNIYFNLNYLKENIKKHNDINHFFKNKVNFYKCSICCMLFKWNIEKNDNIIEEENDNFNSLCICNLCSVQYDHILKLLVYDEGYINFNKINKERNEKRKLHELLFFIIKMNYNNMYKRSVYKEMYNVLDEIFKGSKENIKLLYFLLFYNNFFKYEEFYFFFMNRIKKDTSLKKNFFLKDIHKPCYFTNFYIMKYMLDLFYVRIYKIRRMNNKTFTYLFNIYNISRKTLFIYLNKSNNHFEELVNQSIYFLYLYYLYKLYKNGKKDYTKTGINKKFKIQNKNDKKKNRKKKENIFCSNISNKIENNNSFENIKHIFNEKESDDFILDKCNEKRTMSNLNIFKNNKEKKNNLYKKENSGESITDLCNKEILTKKKNTNNNSNNIIKKSHYKDEFQKNIKEYVKKVKFTIKNKLTLYVKIMLHKYIEESLNFFKYQNIEKNKKKNSKICFLCSFGNYLYKGRLIPFYNLYLHSECLKWSLNCIQYYNFNSNNCEYNLIKGNENIKKKRLFKKENTKIYENKKNKNKSVDNDSNYNKDVTKIFNYMYHNNDLNNENKICKNSENINQSNLNYVNTINCNSSKEKKYIEMLNFNNNVKSIKLMDNCKWTENKNFFNLYENMIEIEEDDVKEIIYDSINSICFLCGYKNASIYCCNENCNIKFHLNCAFYSTVIRDCNKNNFFHYLKCFNISKFNNDTIFYNFNNSLSSNKEDKKHFENQYKDIFPVHIIYKIKKIWCNKCWNLKKVYRTFYIEKKNVYFNNNDNYENIKTNKYINNSNNCSSYNDTEIKIENNLNTKDCIYNIDTNNNDEKNSINEKKNYIKKLNNKNLILNKKIKCGKTNKNELMNKNEVNKIYHLNKKEIFKYIIQFYFENESYYVFDQILYNLNQCIKIKYKNKSLKSLQDNLNKEKKIESKMQEIEKFINKYINISNDSNFINNRYQLLCKQNILNNSHNEETKNNLNYINIENIINNKNTENILKCYFILKNFLFIGKDINLRNEEYFFKKKKSENYEKNLYDNEQSYNIYLPNVLCENEINSISIKKELNSKEKGDKSNYRNLLYEENVFNKENENNENYNKSNFITYLDDTETDNVNYDNNTNEKNLEKMKVNNSSYGKKGNQMKNINIYFELTDKIKKVRITKFQDVCKYEEIIKKNKKYEHFDERNEEKKSNFISSINLNSEKNENILEINNTNDIKEKKEHFLSMIINKYNDVYIKKINDKYFSIYKKNTYNNSNMCKSKIIKIGCHNILSIGEILKYDGEKMVYPCGFLNMRIFFNLPSFYLFYIYNNVNINDLVIKKKVLEEIFLQMRATYIFSITLKNNNFFFSIILFPLISIDYFSEEDAKKFILAEGYDINEVYIKFLSLFNCNNDKYITDKYVEYIMKHKHIYKYLQNYIYKSVEYNKLIDVHDFFGLTLPCITYQIKYKLFKFLWKNLSDKIKSYVKQKREREESKKKIKNNMGEVIYNDNLLCKYSNFEASIFKENEKENEKNMRKTVKYKYNINSAMSYRYLMNISSNSRLYVKKSNIHGYGLYTCEFINEGEPVIEYIGEYIRNIISDKREKYYDKIESSCYMFRLNENIIIDATKWGNVSRFINHSCEPNCFCKIVTCDQNLKHIVIFAKRDIVAHEEITYDYQFGIESEGKKLICLCGSSTCLGRMN